MWNLIRSYLAGRKEERKAALILVETLGKDGWNIARANISDLTLSEYDRGRWARIADIAERQLGLPQHQADTATRWLN